MRLQHKRSPALATPGFGKDDLAGGSISPTNIIAGLAAQRGRLIDRYGHEHSEAIFSNWSPEAIRALKRAKSVVAHDAPKLVSKRGRVGEGRPRSFAADTAAATGLSKSQINRLIAEPKLEVEGEVLDQPHPLDPPGFLDRRKGGRGEKDEAEAAAVASAEKGGVSKTTVRPKPKPEPKRYTARPLPKPRSGKPILGLEAARRHYLDQCAGADVDLEQERDIILDALRELADKRAIAGKPKCTEGEREQSELFKQVKRGGLYRTPPADCFPPTPTPQNESEKENG